MTTYKGALKTIVDTPPSPSTWVTAGYVRGKSKINIDYYVGLGTEASGSIIKMGQVIDTGAMVLGVSVWASAATGSLTVSVGDGDSATRYASADTTLQTANLRKTFPSPLNSTTGLYIIGTNTSDNQIQLTTGGATLGAATIIACAVEYFTE